MESALPPNPVIGQVAQRLQVELIDLEQEFATRRITQYEVYFTIDQHPNSRGYQVMAELICGHLLLSSLSPASVAPVRALKKG